MGLADELKALQELHEKGNLTDQEYADAKAAVLRKQAVPQASAASAEKKSPGCLTIGAIIIGAVVVLFIILAVIGSSNKTSPSSYGIDTSAQAQQGREEWIANAKATGIFLKVDDTEPFAWVGPAWPQLTFEQKQKAAGVVAAYFYLKDSKNTVLILEDGYTGKRVGVYGLEAGLQLD